jgi:predicted O-methyltransferase YrrM
MIPIVNEEYYQALLKMYEIIKIVVGVRNIQSGLEIGTGWGTSAQAFLNSFPSASLVTVDQENYHNVWGPLRRMYGDRITIIKGFSPTIYKSKPPELEEIYDYIFIDAAHDYESVSEDILGCVPLLALKGVIAFDDYGVTGRTEEGKEFGVTKAVDQFIPDNWPEIYNKRNIKAFLNI